MFKPTLSLPLIVCVISSSLWAADNPFVGDWKLNPVGSKLTDVMRVDSLGDNKYVFNFGGGPQTIVVNGTEQPGRFGGTVSVAVKGPHTWNVVGKRDGRMVVSAIWNLSEDGSTLSDDFTGFNANGSPNNLNYVYKRKGGGSGFAGEWVSTSETVNSVVVLQIRPYEDGLSFTEPATDITRKAKFDGKDYPNAGPNAAHGSTSSIRQVNEHVLEMTSKINGEVLNTQKIELSSDLKTLTVTRLIVGETEPNIRVFERQ